MAIPVLDKYDVGMTQYWLTELIGLQKRAEEDLQLNKADLRTLVGLLKDLKGE